MATTVINRAELFAGRTTLDVLQSHIVKSACGAIAENIEANYSPDIVVMTPQGIYRGKQEAKKALLDLCPTMKDGAESYNLVQFSGDYVLTERKGLTLNGDEVVIGESLVIRDGCIAVQMVHVLKARD